MNTDAKSRRNLLDKHAKALRTHCCNPKQQLGAIDSRDKLDALEKTVVQWFAEQGAELDPIDRVLCVARLFDGKKASSTIDAKGLTGKEKTEWWLRLFGNRGLLDIPPLPKDGWPPPLHYRVKDIKTLGSDKFLFGHFTSLFEVFLHFHFTVLASQFLWMADAAANTESDDPPSALTLFGLKVVHAALTDSHCMGGKVWLQRGAGLSKAGQALCEAGVAAPCGELFALLDPDAIDPKLGFDLERGDYPVGRLSARAEVLDFWQTFRNKEHAHPDVPTAPVPKDQLRGVLRLKDLLGELFGVYREYRLAYIGVTDRSDCVIQGIWDQAGDYLAWNNPDNEADIEAIWGRPEAATIPAPEPPGLLEKRDYWDGSLLLYHPQAPPRALPLPDALGLPLRDQTDRFPRARAGRQRDLEQ